MIRQIDQFINSITMYRLVLYGLLLIGVYSIVCGFLGVIAYNGFELIYSASIFFIICFLVNKGLSKLTRAPVNTESWAITALILFFLFAPPTTVMEAVIICMAGILAIGSKFFLTIHRKPVFNPAAIAAVLFSANPGTVALWWVGNPILFPVVLLVGLLVVRKVRKIKMLIVFITASLLGVGVFGFAYQVLSIDLFATIILSSPIIFLGTIMLTEPMTCPPARKFQVIYGAIVGFLSVSQFEIGPVHSSPELALIFGNLFSYMVSPKVKLELVLRQKKEIAKEIYEFVFGLNLDVIATSGSSMHTVTRHRAGQYMEWTLPHKNVDNRGIRRLFTIASSPESRSLRLCVRAGVNMSSFKRRLLELERGDKIYASQLAGEFVLPDDKNEELVFIAGGIGVTPFVSMTENLMNKNENRQIILLYFNKTVEEIAFRDLFDEAGKIGLEAVYILTDHEHIPANWKGKIGRLDVKMLKREVPDYPDRRFYISGPSALVNNYKQVLLDAGVKRSRIMTDYFPGF